MVLPYSLESIAPYSSPLRRGFNSWPFYPLLGGHLISDYKNPNKPIGILECHEVFQHCSYEKKHIDYIYSGFVSNLGGWFEPSCIWIPEKCAHHLALVFPKLVITNTLKVGASTESTIMLGVSRARDDVRKCWPFGLPVGILEYIHNLFFCI